MPFYKWYGVDLEGNKRRGTMMARSVSELDTVLLQSDIACLKWYATKPFVMSKRVPLSMKVQFFRQLAILLQSGIFLDQALELLLHQINHRAFNAVVQDILLSVQHGSRLSQAVMDHPAFFDLLTMHMVEIGQESGKLSQALEQLCHYQDSILHFKKKVRSSAILPIITLLFFVVIALIIFMVVVPAFATLFLTTGQALPQITHYMIAISTALRSPWLWIGSLMTLATVFIGCFFLERSSFYNKILYYFYHVPFLGPLASQATCAYFFHSLSLLTQAGVHVITALRVVQETMMSSLMKKLIQSIKDDVEQGIPMCQALQRHSAFFPAPVQALIEVGQESGCLPFMFMQASALYKDTVNRRLTVLTTILQPALMIIIGLMITFLIFAVYMPIFNLSSVIS